MVVEVGVGSLGVGVTLVGDVVGRFGAVVLRPGVVLAGSVVPVGLFSTAIVSEVSELVEVGASSTRPVVVSVGVSVTLVGEVLDGPAELVCCGGALWSGFWPKKAVFAPSAAWTLADTWWLAKVLVGVDGEPAAGPRPFPLPGVGCPEDGAQ